MSEHIELWKNNVKEDIRRVTEEKSDMQIGIETSGVPNYHNPLIHDESTVGLHVD